MTFLPRRIAIGVSDIWAGKSSSRSVLPTNDSGGRTLMIPKPRRHVEVVEDVRELNEWATRAPISRSG